MYTSTGDHMVYIDTITELVIDKDVGESATN